MKEDAAVDAALEHLPRDEDGGLDIKALEDEVFDLIDFDAVAERRNKAIRAIKRRRKPGSTTPSGQLVMPGMEPYAYEPDRLVADNEGRVIEQARAPVAYKQAEAERARANAKRQLVTADRKTHEAEIYARWLIQQATAGRDIKGLGFDDFVREAELWHPEPVLSDALGEGGEAA